MKNNKPEPQRNDNSTWMVAYITYDVTEAHVVAGRLKHEGIMAIVEHLAGRGAIGITIGNWGEVRVLVHPVDYEDSQMILFPEEQDSLIDPDNIDTVYLDISDEDEDDK